MSSIGSNFFYSIMEFFALSIGRAGARQTRRLILRIAVGWVPPDGHPSGACLAQWTRVSSSLFTRPRMTPHRGCASSDGYLNPFGDSIRLGFVRGSEEKSQKPHALRSRVTGLYCTSRADTVSSRGFPAQPPSRCLPRVLSRQSS